jgi:hypothetical protein
MSDSKTVFVVCAAALLLAACAGESNGVASMPVSGASGSVSSSAPPKVQDGPLTPTGTRLAFGATARTMYRTKPETADPAKGKDIERTKVGITQVSVKKGSVGDFRNVRLKADVVDKGFFYVTMDYTNLGPLPLDPTAITTAMSAYDAAGDRTNWLVVSGSFFPCDSKTDSTSLAVGETFTGCTIVTAPANQDVSKVEFAYYEPGEYRAHALFTWPAR